MKYLFALLILTGCNHFGYYSKSDVVNMNRAYREVFTVIYYHDNKCETKSKQRLNPQKVLKHFDLGLEMLWRNIPNGDIGDFIDAYIEEQKSIYYDRDFDCKWDNLDRW